MTTLTILDGGMGRELKRIGAPFSQPLWSAQALIEAPHYVKQAHESFIDAGAEIITVNSYACVPFHLGETLFSERGPELAKLAAKLARQAADESKRDVLVAGAIPPFFGSYRPELFDAERAGALTHALYHAQAPYVDLWLVETISSLEEARVIAKAMSISDKPVHFAFTLIDEVTEEAKLRSGESVKEAVTLMLSRQADGLFFNCSIPEVIEQALIDTTSVINALNATMTLGVYANSFSPILSGHQANGTLQEMRHFSPQEYLELAKVWAKRGASVIGGCCGIGPEHIDHLSEWKHTLRCR